MAQQKKTYVVLGRPFDHITGVDKAGKPIREMIAVGSTLEMEPERAANFPDRLVDKGVHDAQRRAMAPETAEEKAKREQDAADAAKWREHLAAQEAAKDAAPKDPPKDPAPAVSGGPTPNPSAPKK